jgi:hypothetical protein
MKVDLSKPMTAQQRSEYINELLRSKTLTEQEKNSPVSGCVSSDLDKENNLVQIQYSGDLGE